MGNVDADRPWRFQRAEPLSRQPRPEPPHMLAVFGRQRSLAARPGRALMDRGRSVIGTSGYQVWPREAEDVVYSHPKIARGAIPRRRPRNRSQSTVDTNDQ